MAVISADDHIDLQYLPEDLFRSRLPTRLVDDGPQVVEGDDGPTWVTEGRTLGAWAGGTGSAARRSFRTALERAGLDRPGELRPTTPELRLADMDRDGVDATVMYGPVRALDVRDPTLRSEVHRAYNDWLTSFCSASPDRLLGVAVVPAEDPAAAADEVERLAEGGRTRQVSLHVARATESVHAPAWERFWDIIEASGIIASFHLVLEGWMLEGIDREPTAVYRTTRGFITQFLEPFVSLVGHGILERRPGARVVLAESGLGWLPWVVQEMDYRFRRLQDNRAYWEERGGLDLQVAPSEIFRRQVWVTFQDDQAGLDLLHHFGEDKVMWASDYPHPDSTWPESAAAIERQTAGLDPVARRRLLHDNAAALYGLG